MVDMAKGADGQRGLQVCAKHVPLFAVPPDLQGSPQVKAVTARVGILWDSNSVRARLCDQRLNAFPSLFALWTKRPAHSPSNKRKSPKEVTPAYAMRSFVTRMMMELNNVFFFFCQLNGRMNKKKKC